MIGSLIARIQYHIANRSYASKRKYLRNKGAVIGETTRLMCGTSAFGTEPFLITVGERCLITDGVKIFTHDGGVSVLNNLKYFGDKRMDKMAPVKIGNNVYIGNNALIMPGVTIGDNCIIGAGTIVSKDIPDNSVAVGVPARVVKTIDQYRQSAEEKNVFYPTAGLSQAEKRRYFEGRFR